MIKVTKAGELYETEYTSRDGTLVWKSVEPVSANVLIETLIGKGAHEVDIFDALKSADPGCFSRTKQESEKIIGDDLTWLGITSSQLEVELRKRGHTTINIRTGKVNDTVIPGSVEQIAKLHPDLRDAFAEWWNTGNLVSTKSFEGWSLEDLTQGRGRAPKMKPIGAFLTLDDLIREPEKTNTALNRGYDIISPASPRTAS